MIFRKAKSGPFHLLQRQSQKPESKDRLYHIQRRMQGVREGQTVPESRLTTALSSLPTYTKELVKGREMVSDDDAHGWNWGQVRVLDHVHKH